MDPERISLQGIQGPSVSWCEVLSALPRCRLAGCSNALGRLFARTGALRRCVVCEASGDAHDLGSQGPELLLGAFIGDSALGVEDAKGGGDGDHVGEGPAAQRSDREPPSC